mgnify:CR=1 FL=1
MKKKKSNLNDLNTHLSKCLQLKRKFYNEAEFKIFKNIKKKEREKGKEMSRRHFCRIFLI